MHESVNTSDKPDIVCAADGFRPLSRKIPRRALPSREHRFGIMERSPRSSLIRGARDNGVSSNRTNERYPLGTPRPLIAPAFCEALHAFTRSLTA